MKGRNCATCIKQKEFGCYEDATKPIRFDGEIANRCPMIPIRDNSRFYSEIISLYSAREKGLYAEDGGYYDQPNAYNKLMGIVESAIAESMDMEQQEHKQRQEEIDSIQKLGLNILPARK